MSATFDEAVEPLLNALGAIEADVQEKEAELAELRDKRNRLRTAVRYLKPEALPKANGARKRSPNEARGFGEETLQKVEAFIRARYMHDEFSGIDLNTAGVGFTVSTINPVLRHLHTTGFLRLVRQGKGGLRHYEVIQ